MNDFKPFSSQEQLKYEMKMILKILRNRYIRKTRKIRTKSQVQADYDELSWKKVLESEYWRKINNLNDFCWTFPPNSNIEKNAEIICLVNGQIGKYIASSILKDTAKKVFDICRSYVDDKDEIVELGCGFGSRIFPFRVFGIKNSLEGYDISQNAIYAAKKINEHFRSDIKFGTIDLTETFDNRILNNKTVFTHHALEQLKHHTESVITNLLKGKPKQVLHFEPVRELFGYSLYDIAYKIHNSNADYQDNLLITLKKFEKDNLLTITRAERLHFGNNPFNETSLIHWIPN